MVANDFFCVFTHFLSVASLIYHSPNAAKISLLALSTAEFAFKWVIFKVHASQKHHFYTAVNQGLDHTSVERGGHKCGASATQVWCTSRSSVEQTGVKPTEKGVQHRWLRGHWLTQFIQARRILIRRYSLPYQFQKTWQCTKFFFRSNFLKRTYTVL